MTVEDWAEMTVVGLGTSPVFKIPDVAVEAMFKPPDIVAVADEEAVTDSVMVTFSSTIE